MSCEKLRLQVRNEAERRGFVQKGVTPFLLLALLPCRQDRAAAVVGEQHRAAIAGLEIARPQLVAVEQRKRKPVRKDGTQFLHQIEREAWPSRPVPMQEADSGIEAHALSGAAAIMSQQRIEK